MVLITSLFVIELYFFFVNFREGASDIVFINDLEVEKCAHVKSKIFSDLYYLRRQNTMINLNRNENQFFALYTLIPHEYESYSNKPEIIVVLPVIRKSSVNYCCVSCFSSGKLVREMCTPSNPTLI